MRSSAAHFVASSSFGYGPAGDGRISISDLSVGVPFSRTSSSMTTTAAITHTITTDSLSPPRQGHVSISSQQPRKRSFDSISTHQPMPVMHGSNSLIQSASSPSRLSQANGPFQEIADIGHMLAFSEDDDDDDDTDILLMQQRCQQQQMNHGSFAFAPTARPLQAQLNPPFMSPRATMNYPPRLVVRPPQHQRAPYDGIALSTIPAIGYRTYQPDVLNDIFR
jgi:hypothetical protein